MSYSVSINLKYSINFKNMFVNKELSVYAYRKKKNKAKKVGFGYRLDNKLLFGPPCLLDILFPYK